MSFRRSFAIILTVLNAGCGAESSRQSADSSAPAVPFDSTTVAIMAEPLRALGTEPFWALDVDSNGLRFITPDDTSGIRFAPIVPTVVSDTVVWSGQAEGMAIEVRVWTSKCSDGMSDREYPYASRVAIGGIAYRGCATRRKSIAAPGPRA
jgi:uncharacterized membrane protein